MQVNMNKASSKLAELGELAWLGEEAIIAKAGKPFLCLAPYSVPGRQADRTAEVEPRRLSGALKGHIWAPDFDDMPEELIDRIDTR
ncbi:MAG: type II toxin-antitoxin system prevent-host-death family antitoxin [Dehalococcoidia bacterium]|nr:type II toxin-antitoxin system prevent-host-death family antitoxin [Dehalococcoidia bacterium]